LFCLEGRRQELLKKRLIVLFLSSLIIHFVINTPILLSTSSNLNTMSKSKLHELIQHLSQSEKRYFKRYLSRYSENNHESIFGRLFDYLSLTEVYDKEQLLRECPFVKLSQLQNLNNRLYVYVLESLRAYNSNKSHQVILHETLTNYEILLRKGLYEQCLRLLNKGEKIAIDNENYLFLNEILSKKVEVITKRLKMKKSSDVVMEIQRNEEHNIGILLFLIELKKMYEEVYSLFKVEGRIVRDMRLLDSVVAKFEKAKDYFELYRTSFRVKFYYYNVERLINQLSGDIIQTRKDSEKMYDLFESRPDRISVFSNEYNQVLNNYCIALNMNMDNITLNKIIYRMRERIILSKDDKDLELQMFESYFFLKLEGLLISGNYSKAIISINENMNFIEKLDSHIHSVNRGSKYYRIALAYFVSGDYKKSLKWVNRVLNTDDTKYRKDIALSFEILNLLIHYELKNFDFLKNLLEKAKNRLLSIDRFLIPERLILSTLKNVCKNRKKKSKVFKNLLYELGSNELINPLDKNVLAYYDVKKWVATQVVK
jgi:tetratricopeptide (TPR) repeat protein